MATHYEVLPIPALLEHTRMFAAGAVTFGVEYRLLDEVIIAAEYGADARAKFGNELPPGLPAQLAEDGVSVHVFDTADGGEYLRFDCFSDYPHYHYITPGERRQSVLEFDSVANGPMFVWLIERLHSDLGAMLRHAKAPELAEKLDRAQLDRVLPEVEREMLAAAARGRPTRV